VELVRLHDFAPITLAVFLHSFPNVDAFVVGPLVALGRITASRRRRRKRMKWRRLALLLFLFRCVVVVVVVCIVVVIVCIVVVMVFLKT
jgi:predicted anti-sigma-YlaC factor YlaD